MTDGDRVYCLLRSLTSYIETPRGSLSGRTSGMDTVHGRWISCSRCAGGRVIGHGSHAQPCLVCKESIRKKLVAPLAHGCRPCLNCQSGWRRARVGEEPEDPYLRKGRGVKDLYDSRLALERRREDETARARSLERRLEDELAVREGRLHDLSPEGWEYARDALRKRGSYDELDRALQWLADHETLAYRVLMSVEVNTEPVEVTAELRSALDRIVGMVVERMRLVLDGPILVPFWLLVEHRSAQLERAFRSNQGFRDIAREVGVSEKRVRELRREWQDRQQVAV